MTEDSRRAELMAAAHRAYEAAHGNPLPEPVTALRWRIQPRVAVTSLVVVAILVAGAVFASRPEAQVIPDPVGVASAPVLAVEGEVTVHVAGAVERPGVYELAAGARVADAVAAAGGVTAEAFTDTVNLARTLSDGEQVVIPTVESVHAMAVGPGPGLININHADAGQLDTLPGIGPVLAQRIVANREAHGPFSSLDDLGRVSGIGPAVVEKLAGLATV